MDILDFQSLVTSLMCVTIIAKKCPGASAPQHRRRPEEEDQRAEQSPGHADLGEAAGESTGSESSIHGTTVLDFP